jgi:hypothetical protein
MDPLSRPIWFVTSDEAHLLHLLQVPFCVKGKKVFKKKVDPKKKKQKNQRWKKKLLELQSVGTKESYTLHQQQI